VRRDEAARARDADLQLSLRPVGLLRRGHGCWRGAGFVGLSPAKLFKFMFGKFFY
jgi:hypothetical protein